ncbi:putative Flap endonuclease 1 [Paratrimastix pyriformis]|uniref:Flap endonuclease 1 n=1 Tax=Paratrimastix pyriformis TaxID=342808 RepID=A0ABQ8UVE1_9EUKA|nr:putative Flap endonuclease 1 [Paratrimastix pyriformis]
MGIKHLMQVILENAPDAVVENPVPSYFGRVIGIDASMALYQFLIAVRVEGQQLTNDKGEVTSHLMGMFTRTTKMMAAGLRPVYVFDGRPPEAKQNELARRHEVREDAKEKEAEAKEAGDQAEMERFSRRQVRVNQQHCDEAKRLLTLMGIPYIEAPGEAEAQCAALCRAGKIWATGSEDMDSLCFGSPILLRNLTFSEARKLPIREVHLDQVIAGLGLTMPQFVDFCILCGCDYCGTIKGIGEKNALKLIKRWGTIEQALEHLDKTKFPLPESFNYQQARALFQQPEVLDPARVDLRWGQPDEEGLVQFLVGEKQFAEDRVRATTARLRASKQTATQSRLEQFMGPPAIMTSCSAPPGPWPMVQGPIVLTPSPFPPLRQQAGAAAAEKGNKKARTSAKGAKGAAKATATKPAAKKR